MLDPDLVLSTFVMALRSIPEVVAQLGGDSTLISGHTFTSGVEFSLAMSIFKMQSPSILVAYLDLLGGNFNGSTIWKHRFEVYIRPKNAAMGSVSPPGGAGVKACSPQHLWYLMMNRPMSGLGSTQHIRGDSLPGLNASLYLMDTPTLVHRTDEEQQDLFVGSVSIAEAGDQS